MVHPRIVAFPDSQPGTGVLGPVDAGVLTRTSDVDNKFYGSKYVTQVDTCAPGASCSPGRRDYVWAPNAGDVHEYQQGVSDKRGSWTVQLRGAAPSGQAVQLSELTWSFKGALDADGGTPLDQTSFGYQYSAKGEQQLKSVFRDSVLGVAGSKSETQHSYDPTTNRLTKTIQHGWTSTFSGSTWSTAERYVGTFYFTNHSCLGDAADPLGRAVEVHGPCLVSGFNATNCDGGGPVPITQTFYWPLTESTARAGRVQKTVRFTNNVGLSCATAASLTTTYSTYDARGMLRLSRIPMAW